MEKNPAYEAAMKKIFYGAGVYFILGIFGYVLMFLFKVFVARHFTPSEFGLFEFASTILGVLVVFSDFGLASSIQRFVSIYNENNQKGLIKGLRLFSIIATLIFSLILALLLYTFSGYIASFFRFPQELALFLKIVSIGIPLRSVHTVLTNLLISEKKPFHAGFGYNVLERIILLVGIILIISFDLNLIYLFILFVISLLLSLTVTLLFFRKRIKYDEKAVFDTKAWFYFSIPLLFSGMLYFMISWIDNFIIGKVIGSQALGIYSIAYSLGSIILFISTAFLTLFVPVMTALYLKKKADFRSVFEQITKWVFAAAVFFGLILFAFSSEIIRIFFGASYVSGSASLMVLSVLFVLSALFSFYSVIIIIEGNTRFLFMNNIVFLAFTLILGIIMAKFFGISGVALSSGLGYLLLRVSEYFRSRKYFRVQSKAIPLFKIFLAGLFSVFSVKILSLIIRTASINDMIKTILLLIVYIVVFSISFFAMKILSKEDLEFMLLLEKSAGLNLKVVKNFFRKLI